MDLGGRFTVARETVKPCSSFDASTGCGTADLFKRGFDRMVKRAALRRRPARSAFKALAETALMFGVRVGRARISSRGVSSRSFFFDDEEGTLAGATSSVSLSSA